MLSKKFRKSVVRWRESWLSVWHKVGNRFASVRRGRISRFRRIDFSVIEYRNLLKELAKPTNFVWIV
jgi:hypothetical protein